MPKNFDLEFQALQLQNEMLRRDIAEVHKMLEHPIQKTLYSKEYYTVEDCAEMKGGAALNTYKANRFLLPGCGNPKFAVFICGRLSFPKQEVLKWLRFSDANYLDYAKECGVTVVPDKYLRMFQKARQKEEVTI